MVNPTIKVKKFLMKKFSITENAAYHILRRQAMNSRLTILDVSKYLIEWRNR